MATKSTTTPTDNVVEVPAEMVVKRGRKPKVAVLLDTDDFARDQVHGFVDFLREHAIVGLAVGFVIGTQAQTVVKQLVASFIDPMFTLVFGKNLSTRTFTLHLFKNHADFGWGAYVYAMLNLIFVLAAIYALIKIFNLDKLDKPKP